MKYIYDGPATSPLVFAFAHGAGAPMDTPWMNQIARREPARDLVDRKSVV